MTAGGGDGGSVERNQIRTRASSHVAPRPRGSQRSWRPSSNVNMAHTIIDMATSTGKSGIGPQEVRECAGRR